LKTVQDQKFLEFLQELKSFQSGLYQVLDGEFYSFVSKYQVVWQHNNTRLLKFTPSTVRGAPPPHASSQRKLGSSTIPSGSWEPDSVRKTGSSGQALGKGLDPSFRWDDAVVEKHSSNGNARMHVSNTNPILFIPSLINAGYILDIMPGSSLVEAMSGAPCYLIDWGDPMEEEGHYRLEDYYKTRVAKALELITAEHGRRVDLVGYCLGGVISIMSAVLSNAVERLVLLACPWDFSCYRDKVLLFQTSLDWLLATKRLISSQFIRNFFLSFTPMEKFYKKFVEFAGLDPADPRRELFLRVEKWSLDNRFISNGVMKEVMQQFALQNILATEGWVACGERITLDKIKAKTFIVAGETDAVVPYISTSPLINQIKSNRSVLLPTGHIGIVIGRHAKELQMQLIAWLREGVGDG
jgi:poly(3-hydroxyalkanoate) synthetase